jgi:hypothetical protein
MPNKKRRHKHEGHAPPRVHVRTSRRVDSVKALLERLPGPALGRIGEQASQQLEWRQWLAARLPAATVPHLTGVVERENTLVIFTESAAWSARTRYAVAEIEAQIRQARPSIARISVRVMPKGMPSPR